MFENTYQYNWFMNMQGMAKYYSEFSQCPIMRDKWYFIYRMFRDVPCYELSSTLNYDEDRQLIVELWHDLTCVILEEESL